MTHAGHIFSGYEQGQLSEQHRIWPCVSIFVSSLYLSPQCLLHSLSVLHMRGDARSSTNQHQLLLLVSNATKLKILKSSQTTKYCYLKTL